MTHRAEGTPCARCKSIIDTYPAISRRDNKTPICPYCGTVEAYEDASFIPPYRGEPYWEVSA